MDREKVMSWLEGLAEPDWRDFHSDSEVQNIAKSALELLKAQRETIDELISDGKLLKEQEAVKLPIDAFGHPYCPKCKILIYEAWEFCPHCGKAVKLE